MRSAISGFVLAAAMLITGASAIAAPPPKPAAFAVCSVCHKTDRGAPSGVGPNLFGIGGTKAGFVPNYTFSPAMKKSGIVWNKANLIRFISAPQKTVPGTKMGFAGVRDPKAAEAIANYILALK